MGVEGDAAVAGFGSAKGTEKKNEIPYTAKEEKKEKWR